MKVIYSRVSTDKQDTENQLSRLREMHPDASVVEETASGAKRRPVLEGLLASLQKGDLLIVASLDRLGRRTSEVLRLIEDLERRGVILKSIREGVDYSTIAGRLVTQILVSVAEMERGLISERTKAALAAKKAKGMKLGREPIYSLATIARAKEMRAGGALLKDIARETGMSVSRVFEVTNQAN